MKPARAFVEDEVFPQTTLEVAMSDSVTECNNKQNLETFDETQLEASMNQTVESRNPAELKPHPLNEKIYGDALNPTLVRSIKDFGFHSPILIAQDNTILNGHSRCAAALQLKLEKIPMIVSPITHELEKRALVISGNSQRDKSREQKAREYMELKVIEEEKARNRQREAAQRTNLLHQDKTENDGRSQDSTEAWKEDTGESRKIAAGKLGISYTTAEESARVVQLIDLLSMEGNKDEAENLREILNTKSVNAAFMVAKPIMDARQQQEPDLGLDPKVFDVKKIEDHLFVATLKGRGAARKAKFDKNKGILRDLAKWIWEPLKNYREGDSASGEVGGKEREGADSAVIASCFFPYQLEAPSNTKKPKDRPKKPERRTVLVCPKCRSFR
jgi:hypothetical protein